MATSLGSQKTVSLGGPPPLLGLEEEEETDGQEKDETRSAFLEYVFQRATSDGGLSRDQARTFQNAQMQSAAPAELPAAVVGRRLAQIGEPKARELCLGSQPYTEHSV